MNTHQLADHYRVYAQRRAELLSAVQNAYPMLNKQSIIVLIGGFENERTVFRQESSFYYLTGISEPGVVLVMTMDGSTTLWYPASYEKRFQWVDMPVDIRTDQIKQWHINQSRVLGEASTGFQMHPFFPREEYAIFIDYLESIVSKGARLLTLSPNDPGSYVEQRLILERLKTFVPTIHDTIVNISSFVHTMRRRKDMHEIELLYKAVDITCLAHEAAARSIGNDSSEAEVQASLEYIMIGSGARPSFPSIVAGGKNSTILHYHTSADNLTKGDVVVVDIGAEYKMYCGDITRTYPVSGTFNVRQKELYQLVLDTQEYIAEQIRPGIWLNNAQNPENSLNHKAKQFLKDLGYGEFFSHSIGHFLGLDVHDVGDYQHPLQEGDVITVEPGLYIPQEKIGIRIEDNYWVVKDGSVCLSEHLPKRIDAVESFMNESRDSFEDQDQEYAQG